MAGCGLVVEQRAVGDGDDACVGIDREAPAGGVGQAVADRVAAVGVGRECRDADSGAISGVLGDGVCSAVAIRDGPDVGLVGVGKVDGEGLCRSRAVGGGGLDGDAVTGRGLVVEQRAVCDRDHPAVGVDGEAAAGGVGEAVADSVGTVGVGRQGGHPDGRAIGGVLGDAVGTGVAVRDGADIELVDIGQVHRKGLSAGRAVGRSGLDRDRVTGGGLVIQERAVGDSDNPAVGVDGEPAAGGVGQAVADRVGAIGIGREGRDSDGGAVGGVFGDAVSRAVAVGDRADVGLVSIREIDRKCLSAGRTVGRGGLDGDRVAGGGLVVEE